MDASPLLLRSFSSDANTDGAEVANEVLELAARHVGYDIFDIQQWPLCVHVGDGKHMDRPFESRSWGELYPTLHSAEVESFPCVERRHHLPWEVVKAAELLSWRALWHGFTHGYVELNVIQKQANTCIITANEPEKRHLLQIYASENLGVVLYAFHALADAEKHEAFPDMELEKRWIECANGHLGTST